MEASSFHKIQYVPAGSENPRNLLGERFADFLMQ